MNTVLRHDTDGATRLWLWCPGCREVHAAFVAGHATLWTWNGDLDAPTLSPSLLVSGRYAEPPVTAENLDEWKRAPWEQRMVDRVCHSFIVDGTWQFLSDCTHPLAGQHIPMASVEPHWPWSDTPQEA